MEAAASPSVTISGPSLNRVREVESAEHVEEAGRECPSVEPSTPRAHPLTGKVLSGTLLGGYIILGLEYRPTGPLQTLRLHASFGPLHTESSPFLYSRFESSGLFLLNMEPRV